MSLLLRSIYRMVKIGILTVLGIQSLTPALASVRDEYFVHLTPVSEAVLDSLRGGFQRGPDGPFMSFGIERNVFINEKLISSTRLNIPDMKRLTDHRDFNPFADQRDMRPSIDHSGMKPFADRPNDTFTLIQSGPGNSFHPDLSTLPPFMTVIQNSLDNRTIQSHTVINATVEALTWARSLDVGNALSQASIEAIRH
ncbi:MAG TPA: hypothetical protein VFU48_10975 [Nitrospira sp.]|nr:hypothetical protein [Nitrospira sp.]